MITSTRRLDIVLVAAMAASLWGGGPVAVSATTKPVSAVADQAPAPATPRTLTGKVVMMSSNVCVVKDAAGKSIMVKVAQQTRLEGTVREGATVEATVAPDGTAVLIKALK